MPDEPELLVQRDGRVATLTLNRPHAGNSLTPTLLGDLGEQLTALASDDLVRVIVITGAGERFFCTGTDLSGAPAVTSPEDQLGPPPVHLARGLHMYKPVIAAINGYALGGGLELALACDLRYAAEGAQLGLPEARIGTIPGAGGTQRLPRQIPYAWAMEMLLSGDRWDPARALRAGLINDVYPRDELQARVTEVAHRIAANAPLSLQAIKQAVTGGQHLALADGLRLERSIFNVLRDTEDRIEGRRAFVEKRTPKFHGR